MLKCENLPGTHSTISGAHLNFSKTSTPRQETVIESSLCAVSLLSFYKISFV